MLLLCQHRGRRDHLGLDDLLEQPKAHRNRLGVEHQNLGRRLGVVLPDEGHRCPVGVVLPDVEHQYPAGEVHLDVVYPCPGLRKTDCFQVLPWDAEFPCPGLRRMDCYQGAESPEVE